MFLGRDVIFHHCTSNEIDQRARFDQRENFKALNIQTKNKFLFLLVSTQLL